MKITVAQHRVNVHMTAVEEMEAVIKKLEESEHDFSETIKVYEREIANRKRIIEIEKSRS